MAVAAFGEIIKKLRKASGMNQTELAMKLNCDQAVISRLEKDQQTPSLSQLSIICDIFGLKIDYLIKGIVNYWQVSKRFNQRIDLPKKYQGERTSSFREIMPLISYVNIEHGPSTTHSFLKELKLDSLMFLGPNENISPVIVSDIYNCALKKKLFKKINLKKIVQISHNSEIHGEFYPLLSQLNKSTDKVNFWALNSSMYDSIFHYEVKRDSKEIELKITLKNDEFINEPWFLLYSEYREQYLKEIPKLGSKTASKVQLVSEFPKNVRDEGIIRFSDVA